jgi:2-polyprenyl-3-methyl-5-hydroxy-6-metoxy-1,4-benzoquinol methylase
VSGPAYQPARCVVCGHTDARVVADADDIREEVEALWAFHTRRLRVNTPPARLTDRVAFSQHPPLRVVQCRECGLVYRNPEERALELAATYARDTIADDVLRALHRAQVPSFRRQARRVRELAGRGATGLEVGSYVGAFLAAARAEGLAFGGVDLNAATNAFTRSLGFTVHDGEMATLTEDRQYDVVAIWNTFDQLADPRGALHAARRRLRRGGMLALRVPNGAAYVAYRRLMRRRAARAVARAVLAQNNLLSFPYRHGFTPSSLRRLVGDAGFSVVEERGDVLTLTSDEWTRAWARMEERAMKRLFSLVARRAPRVAPWFELYARRD